MTTAAYMGMADQAIISARILLNANDTDGACNRAYYAMFHAANAALIACGQSPEPKSHMALLRLFSLKLVKTGILPDSLGRSLHNVQNLRHVADYQLVKIEKEAMEGAIGDAQLFVTAVYDYLKRQTGGVPSSEA